jgi:c-di-GMP-binding flagellar brake protein YcgR
LATLTDIPSAWSPIEPIPDGPGRDAFRVDALPFVAQTLQRLAQARTLLSVHGLSAAGHPGRLRTVDIEAARITLDVLGPGTIQLPPATPWTCVAALDGAKLQFELTPDARDATTPDAGWVAPLPTGLYRVQRREFARLDAPLGRPYAATVTLLGRTLEMNVSDLSLGGVGLRADRADAAMLGVGRKLPRVQLEMGADHWLVADLEIRSSRPVRSRWVGEQQLLGCRFLGLSAAQIEDLKLIVDALQAEVRALVGFRGA